MIILLRFLYVGFIFYFYLATFKVDSMGREGGKILKYSKTFFFEIMP